MIHSFALIGTIGSTLTCLILLGFAVFLILLVLVQRGKGGGLSGAFGGMGGQSAFGAKAGDTFTRITVVTATLWILVCIVSAKYLGVSGSRFDQMSSPLGQAEPAAGVLGENVSIGTPDEVTDEEATGGAGAATPPTKSEPSPDGGEN